MKQDMKTLYKAILKEKCLIAPFETEKGFFIQLWDSTGQNKTYLFQIKSEGVSLLMAKSRAAWDEGHPSGSFSLTQHLPGIF